MEYAFKLDTEFAHDIKAGLGASQKWISSKYFYDEIGDKLFQDIMNLPEYYLTRKEFSVLTEHTSAMLGSLIETGEKFNMVELGAGDGLKTKILIKYLAKQSFPFRYFPIDISSSVLRHLEHDLLSNFKDIEVRPVASTYVNALKDCVWKNGARNLMLFLGGNIGNFPEKDAVVLLKQVASSLNPGDLLLIGFDLKKDPKIILDAYNDATGVTKAFNLNVLERINKVFGADFKVDQFKHWPTYDPVSGECRSYLISMEDQLVQIPALDMEVRFKKSEAIHTEVSKKYNHEELEQLAEKAGFKISRHFEDGEHYFTDSLWEVV